MLKDGDLGEEGLKLGASLVILHPSIRAQVEAFVDKAELDRRIEAFNNKASLGAQTPKVSVFGILDTEIK